MQSARLVALSVVLLMLGVSRGGEPIGDRAEVRAEFDPPTAKPGQTVTWRVILSIKPNFHSYPTRQLDPSASDYVTDFTPPKFGEFVFVGDVKDPPSRPVRHEGHDLLWVEGEAAFEGRFVIHPEAKPGKYKIRLRGTLPVCDDKNCLPGQIPAMEYTVADGPAVPVEEAHREAVAKFPLSKPAPPVEPPPPPSPPPAPLVGTTPPEGQRVEVAPPAATFEDHEANLTALRAQLSEFQQPTAKRAGGLLGFLAAAAFWGAVALVTPCVFPMIPITVSFFLHQSQHEHHRPVKMALIYCGTIILVLGISALTLLATFRALSVHPATNIFMGGLFIFFALSLFGLYEITLPSRLTSFTSSREGRGGVVGTVFMALTFTVVSFTCVAPFLGGFSGMAASGQFSMPELVLGALVFSTTFAAPFFVLALFPSLIKKMPQSGSWLNSVKVVMGFLELAAALKFFRTAELALLPSTSYFTYDMVLGMWVALAAVVGLYLLNMFRLHHDEPIEHIGVVRMLLGLTFVGLALYLLPGIFKNAGSDNQRPRGIVFAWVDSFLLPEPSHEEMPWSANLKGTVDVARRELERSGKRQFVFLDCTGVTCTNCKINERDVFSRPDVREHLMQFALVQHYTDTVPEQFYPFPVEKSRRLDEAQFNLKFQRELFGTEQLPLYVIFEVMKDKVAVRGVYEEGKINDVPGFVKFLKDAKKDPKAAK